VKNDCCDVNSALWSFVIYIVLENNESQRGAVHCGEICVTRVVIGIKCVNMCDKAGMNGNMRKRGEFPLNFRRLLHYILIKVQCSAGEPMARLPKMAQKLFLARDMHCCSNSFYFFCGTSVSISCRIYIYIRARAHTHTHTHTYLSAQRLYMNYRCYQIILGMKR